MVDFKKGDIVKDPICQDVCWNETVCSNDFQKSNQPLHIHLSDIPKNRALRCFDTFHWVLVKKKETAKERTERLKDKSIFDILKESHIKPKKHRFCCSCTPCDHLHAYCFKHIKQKLFKAKKPIQSIPNQEVTIIGRAKRVKKCNHYYAETNPMMPCTLELNHKGRHEAKIKW